MLVGKCEIPIAVGVKGGSVNSHPGVKANMEMLGCPSAQELAGIMCSVGLSQNMAALRALCSEGIQKGHMALHARNIVIAQLGNMAASWVPIAADYLKKGGQKRIIRGAAAASAFLAAAAQWEASGGSLAVCPPSSITFQETRINGSRKTFESIVLFDTPTGLDPHHLDLTTQHGTDKRAAEFKLPASVNVQSFAASFSGVVCSSHLIDSSPNVVSGMPK